MNSTPGKQRLHQGLHRQHRVLHLPIKALGSSDIHRVNNRQETWGDTRQGSTAADVKSPRDHGEDVEKPGPSNSAGVNATQLSPAPTIALLDVTERNENIRSHKNLHTHVHECVCIIPNSQKNESNSNAHQLTTTKQMPTLPRHKKT